VESENKTAKSLEENENKEDQAVEFREQLVIKRRDRNAAKG